MALTEIDAQPGEPLCLSDVRIATPGIDAVRVGRIAASPQGPIQRREHCQISWSLANALGISFGTLTTDHIQVRVGVPGGAPRAGSSALYTVAAAFWSLRPEIRFYPDRGADGGGARKLFGSEPPAGARVQVWSRAPSVLHPQDVAQPCRPRHRYFTEPAAADPAAAGGRWLEEWMEKVATPDILLMAPHGGRIEPETDRQAQETLELLGGANVIPNLWVCRGEWRGEDGGDDAAGGGARERWHVASTDLGEAAFPGLAELLDGRRYRYAVAFHGFSWAPGPGVILGGNACGELKRLIRQQIEVNCANAGRGGELAYYLACADDTGQSIASASGNILTRATARDRAGLEAESLVNRPHVARHGLHLAQSPALLHDPVLRLAVARAVATALYLELHDPSGPRCS